MAGTAAAVRPDFIAFHSVSRPRISYGTEEEVLGMNKRRGSWNRNRETCFTSSPTQVQPNPMRIERNIARNTDLRCLHLTHPMRDFL
jgi:hypothetical protein